MPVYSNPVEGFEVRFWDPASPTGNDVLHWCGGELKFTSRGVVMFVGAEGLDGPGAEYSAYPGDYVLKSGDVFMVLTPGEFALLFPDAKDA